MWTDFVLSSLSETALTVTIIFCPTIAARHDFQWKLWFIFTSCLHFCISGSKQHERQLHMPTSNEILVQLISRSVSLQLCSLHLHKEVTTQCNESNCSHSGILNINRYRPGLKQYLSLTYFFKPVVAMKKKYTYIYTICKSMLMTNANFIQVLIYIKSKQNKNHIVILHCIQSIESEHSKDTPGPGKLVCSLITWGKNKNEYWKHRCKMYC